MSERIGKPKPKRKRPPKDGRKRLMEAKKKLE